MVDAWALFLAKFGGTSRFARTRVSTCWGAARFAAVVGSSGLAIVLVVGFVIRARGTWIRAEKGGRFDLGAGTEGVVDDFGASVCHVAEHVHSREEGNVRRSENDVANWTVGHTW